MEFNWIKLRIPSFCERLWARKGFDRENLGFLTIFFPLKTKVREKTPKSRFIDSKFGFFNFGFFWENSKDIFSAYGKVSNGQSVTSTFPIFGTLKSVSSEYRLTINIMKSRLPLILQFNLFFYMIVFFFLFFFFCSFLQNLSFNYFIIILFLSPLDRNSYSLSFFQPLDHFFYIISSILFFFCW